MVTQTVPGRCFHKNERSELWLQENNLQYLLLIIKVELSSENKTFRELVSTTVSLTDSQYLRFF